MLPIYADPDGEIISGHQRHYVATSMGATKLPVERMEPMTLAERKNVNVVFNRGTNDLSADATPSTLTEALERINLTALADRLPDKTPDTPEFYPCLRAEERPIGPLLAANAGRWVQYARNISKTLAGFKVKMPIVVRPNGEVVNGIGRLQLAAELEQKTISVVEITDAEADLAAATLNLLSMDFDIHTRYADVLRYNSFRRSRTTTDHLGHGFTFTVMPKKNAKEFDIYNPEHRERWINVHGTSVVDFGAGHMVETRMLREVGIHVASFEPYRLMPGTEILDLERSRASTREFLEDVASGRHYHSVFLSAVLNSVPFWDDRLHIICIIAALCDPTATTVYAQATSDRSPSGQENIGARKSFNKQSDNLIAFNLDYEPRVSLGELSSNPKAQKFHSDEEFQRLFGTFFQDVRVRYGMHGRVSATCTRPRAINRARLRQAIEFEFDLPYPEERSLGMAEEALRAFSQRLGVEL